MKLFYTKAFKKDYKSLSPKIQEKTDKAISLLLSNLTHPSLRVKKMSGQENIWEGSITMQYRFTFHVEKDIFILRRVGTHNILKSP